MKEYERKQLPPFSQRKKKKKKKKKKGKIFSKCIHTCNVCKVAEEEHKTMDGWYGKERKGNNIRGEKDVCVLASSSYLFFFFFWASKPMEGDMIYKRKRFKMSSRNYLYLSKLLSGRNKLALLQGPIGFSIASVL